MHLVNEAEAMVCAGKTLVSWTGARITVGPTPDGLFAVTGYDGGTAFQRKTFDSSKRAIRFFRAAVKRKGLVEAISAQRYAFLFPCGSSLEWGAPSTTAPATLPARQTA